jgi:GMP synthase (glutamine-hydrolysing)
MKPFLILQLRPEAEAADDEFSAFMAKGGLAPEEVRRVRLDRTPEVGGLDPAGFAGVIVGGGPGCVSDPEAKKSPVEKRIEDAVLSLMPSIVERDLPFLGCCYGIGFLAHHLGAPVGQGRFGEPVGRRTASSRRRGGPIRCSPGCRSGSRRSSGTRRRWRRCRRAASIW